MMWFVKRSIWRLGSVFFLPLLFCAALSVQAEDFTFENYLPQMLLRVDNGQQPLACVRMAAGWPGSLRYVEFELSETTPMEVLRNFKVYHTTAPGLTRDAVELTAVPLVQTGRKFLLDFWNSENPRSGPNIAIGSCLLLTAEVLPVATVDMRFSGVCTRVQGDGGTVLLKPQMSGEARIFPFAQHILPYFRATDAWYTWQEEYIKHVTGVIVFQVGVSNSGELTGKEDVNFNSWLEKIKAGRDKYNPHAQIILGVAHCAPGMITCSADPALRVKLAEDMAAFAKEKGFDGIDIDWEHPTNATQWANYELFLRELKPRAYAVGATVSIAFARFSGPTKAVMSLLDYANSMTYDNAGEHSTMQQAKDDVEWCRNTAKLPDYKIISGLPFYSHDCEGTRNWDAARSWGNIMNDNPALYDNPGNNNFIYNGVRHYFNNVALLIQKGQWLKDQKLGGAMIWSSDHDVALTNRKSAIKVLTSGIPVVRLDIPAPERLYVKAEIGETQTVQNGTSWETALIGSIGLESALDSRPAQIWVSGGTYLLNNTLLTRDGTSVFGGFSGSEVQLSDRLRSDLNGNGVIEPWEFTNSTRLDGQSLYRAVAQHADYNTPVTWDGMVIQNGSSVAEQGGGIAMRTGFVLKNSIVRNCKTTGNSVSGGGIWVCGAGKLEGCLITENTAGYNSGYGGGGGGIAINGNNTGVVKIYNCVISKNTYVPGEGETGANGGAIHVNQSGGTEIVNTVFAYNRAKWSPGINYYTESGNNNKIINCVFIGHLGDGGGKTAISINTDVNITNSIFWENQVGPTGKATYSATQDAYAGTGNITLAVVPFKADLGAYPFALTDEQKAAIDKADWRLNDTSPAVNRGLKSGYPGTADESFDLSGQSRIWKQNGVGIIDMGPYEYEGLGIAELAQPLTAGNTVYNALPYSGISAPVYLYPVSGDVPGTQYKKGEEVLASAPVEPGDYTAHFPDPTFVSDLWRWDGQNLSFTISRAPLSSPVVPELLASFSENMTLADVIPLGSFTGISGTAIHCSGVWDHPDSALAVGANPLCAYTFTPTDPQEALRYVPYQGTMTLTVTATADPIITMIPDKATVNPNNQEDKIILAVSLSKVPDDTVEIPLVYSNASAWKNAPSFLIFSAGTSELTQNVELYPSTGDYSENLTVNFGAMTRVTNGTPFGVSLSILPESVRFVTQTAQGAGNGINWNNSAPGTDLQAILNTAGVTEVHVGAGTYIGTGAGDAFTLPAKVKLIGGYPVSGGTTRDPKLNLTTLTKGNQANTRILRMKAGTTADSTVLDGFVVTGGNFTAGADGIGIYAENYSEILNCTVKNNSAVFSTGGWQVGFLQGGGIYAAGNCLLRCSEINLNSLTSGNSDGPSGYRRAFGGGLYANGMVIVEDCLFAENTLKSRVNSNAIDEYAWSAGGGIYLASGAENSVIRKTSFKNNLLTAYHVVGAADRPPVRCYGGGVYSEAANLVISDVIMSGSVLNAGGADGVKIEGFGGGCFIGGTNSLIDSCRINGNSVTQNGGGVYLASVSTVKDCILSGNSASRGGGIATTAGGAISSSVIANNSAIDATDGSGAGLSVHVGGTLIVENCLIANNANVRNYGGGIAQYQGAAKLLVRNCTVVRNSHYGIHAAGAANSVTVENTIVWGNATPGVTGTISTSNNNAYEDGTGTNFSLNNASNTEWNSGKIAPHFASPSLTIGNDADWASADWALASASPLVNRGKEIDGIDYRDAVDLAKKDRKQVGFVDIGAYESAGKGNIFYAIGGETNTPSVWVDGTLPALSQIGPATPSDLGKIAFSQDGNTIVDPTNLPGVYLATLTLTTAEGSFWKPFPETMSLTVKAPIPSAEGSFYISVDGGGSGAQNSPCKFSRAVDYINAGDGNTLYSLYVPEGAGFVSLNLMKKASVIGVKSLDDLSAADPHGVIFETVQAVAGSQFRNCWIQKTLNITGTSAPANLEWVLVTGAADIEPEVNAVYCTFILPALTLHTATSSAESSVFWNPNGAFSFANQVPQTMTFCAGNGIISGDPGTMDEYENLQLSNQNNDILGPRFSEVSGGEVLESAPAHAYLGKGSILINRGKAQPVTFSSPSVFRIEKSNAFRSNIIPISQEGDTWRFAK